MENTPDQSPPADEASPARDKPRLVTANQGLFAKTMGKRFKKRPVVSGVSLAIQRGVMLFHTMRPSIKICPPLIIPEEALLEGIEVMGEALESIIP